MGKTPYLLEYIQERFAIGKSEITPLDKHGRTFALTIEGNSPMVVKAVKGEGKWKRYVWASDFLQSKGVGVPTMVLPPHALSEKGPFLLFEDLVTGDPLPERKLDPEIVKRVVRAVRHLHSIEDEKWGGCP